MVASRSTSFVLLAACVVLAVAPIVNAHTCLLSPLQRGGAAGATTKVADPRCGLGTGPCGGTKPGASAMTFKTGTSPTIHWIKNLNHYNAAAPGNFTLYGYKNGMMGPMLYTVPDTNTPSLTPYQGTVTIPEDAVPGDYVLQLIYYTGRGFNFYQCADVTLAA